MTNLSVSWQTVHLTSGFPSSETIAKHTSLVGLFWGGAFQRPHYVFLCLGSWVWPPLAWPGLAGHGPLCELKDPETYPKRLDPRASHSKRGSCLIREAWSSLDCQEAPTGCLLDCSTGEKRNVTSTKSPRESTRRCRSAAQFPR